MARRNSTFATRVIARDGECQKCGSAKNLQAHHIIPISVGGADDSNNGVALCAECHAKKHPDVPQELFFIKACGEWESGEWNATTLAARLGVSARTITRAAKKLQLSRSGGTWNFSEQEVETISNIVGRHQHHHDAPLDSLIDTIIEHSVSSVVISMPFLDDDAIGYIDAENLLNQTAQIAFREGRNHALMGLMTAADVAAEFGVSERRARALIQNRHERFGVGMRVGNQWLVHRDELGNLEPDEKYRA